VKAIKQLKSGKAAGPDSTPTEALNADTETMVKVLHPSSRKYGKKNKCHLNGKKDTSSNCQRRET
jgi:hypothetical protein